MCTESEPPAPARTTITPVGWVEPADTMEITSESPTKVLLNGVSLASSNGPAVSTLSPERNHIVLGAGT